MTDASSKANTRGTLVERLYRAFSMQLSDMETRIAEKTGEGTVEDGRVLSGLAKTLETLLSVERKLGETGEVSGALDFQAIRTELADRLATLRLGRSGEQDAPLGEPV